ncbi:hypothetical protein [Flavobacterium microcysteis]
MPESKKLTALTVEELKIKQKKFKGFTSVLSIITLVLLIGSIYFAIQNKNYNLFVLLGGSSFALLLCAVILKQVEAEISVRDLK